MNDMSATAFCKFVEARLGWSPQHPDLPPWKRYQAEAAKVIRKRRTDPDLYTWRNLQLAVEYLRQCRIERSPVGVMAYVPLAVEAAADRNDLDEQIAHAIAREFAKGDPHGWGTRLTNARGQYRVQVFREWEASG